MEFDGFELFFLSLLLLFGMSQLKVVPDLILVFFRVIGRFESMPVMRGYEIVKNICQSVSKMLIIAILDKFTILQRCQSMC